MEFAITNVGTNIVQSGWTFNATLPINGSYTFASQPQQALYPGDKIVYALTFDNTYGQNAYQQYPNYGYGYTDERLYHRRLYLQRIYLHSSYRTTIITITARTTRVITATTIITGTQYTNGTVTITADPQNYVMELNKGNNSASTVVPMY